MTQIGCLGKVCGKLLPGEEHRPMIEGIMKAFRCQRCDLPADICKGCVEKVEAELKAAQLQISIIRNYVNEEGVSDTAKVIRVQGVVNKTEKRVEPCPMNCAERWPDWGHAVECPTRKCAKHGLTVCDECAKKLRG
jgi:hypothetical protein